MAGTTVMAPVRERFSELVATMSPRDRALFVGLVVFVVLALFGGAWWIGRSILGDARSRVADREETLALMRGLADDQTKAESQIATIEAELRKSAGQDLPSFVEKASDKVGISANLQGVREKQVTTEGTLEEKTYTVEVNKITLAQLNSFLYELETGGYPLRVRNTKVKTTTVQGVKMLNVSLEVSAFRLTDAAPAPAEGTAEENP